MSLPDASVSATDDTMPIPVVTQATPTTSAKKAKRRRPRRDLVQKADRSAWRAFWFMVLPLAPAALAYYFYNVGDTKSAIYSAAAIVLCIFVPSPFVLAWSIAAIRRGTRWLPLPIITGFVSATQLVVLAAGIAFGVVGYMVVMNQPVPWLADQQWAQQINTFDFHDFLLGQPTTGDGSDTPIELPEIPNLPFR